VAGRRRRLGSSGVAQAIEAALRAEASPERAEDERRYLKSALTHLGASVPTIRRVVREEWKARGGLARTELLAAVESLWSSGIHECRMAAIELLELGLPVLEARDIRLLERLLRESRTWALVDGLAASVVGPLVEREPALRRNARPVGGRRRLLDPAIRPARPPARTQARRRRLPAVRPLRRRDARRTGILHPKGDRLGSP
jgi:DNA alkylation repair enzyme